MLGQPDVHVHAPDEHLAAPPLGAVDQLLVAVALGELLGRPVREGVRARPEEVDPELVGGRHDDRRGSRAGRRRPPPPPYRRRSRPRPCCAAAPCAAAWGRPAAGSPRRRGRRPCWTGRGSRGRPARTPTPRRSWARPRRGSRGARHHVGTSGGPGPPPEPDATMAPWWRNAHDRPGRHASSSRPSRPPSARRGGGRRGGRRTGSGSGRRGGRGGRCGRGGRGAEEAAEARELNLTIDLCLRIGEVLLSSGAGAADVTATMRSVAYHLGLRHPEIDVTFTSLSMSYHRARGPAGADDPQRQAPRHRLRRPDPGRPPRPRGAGRPARPLPRPHPDGDDRLDRAPVAALVGDPGLGRDVRQRRGLPRR